MTAVIRVPLFGPHTECGCCCFCLIYLLVELYSLGSCASSPVSKREKAGWNGLHLNLCWRSTYSFDSCAFAELLCRLRVAATFGRVCSSLVGQTRPLRMKIEKSDNPSRGDVATGLFCGWITVTFETPKGVEGMGIFLI